MSNDTWKRVELAIARLLDVEPANFYGKIERIPVSGRQRGYAADISHPWWSIELKHRREIPKWIYVLADPTVKYKFYNLNNIRIFKLGYLINTAPSQDHKTMETIAIAKELPLWITEAVDQARKARSREHEGCVVILHEHRMEYNDSLVLLFDED